MNNERSSTAVTRMQALSKVAIALSETLSLDQLLYKAVAHCIEILNFDAAVVYFLDTEGQQFVASHFHGIDHASIAQLQTLPTDCIGGIVIKNGKTVITENLAPYHQQRPQVEGFASLLSVPIKARKQTIGVLDVFSKAYRDFSPEDITLVESIGLQIGVASENAKLFESIASVTGKLRELVQLNQRLASCLHLDSLIPLLTSELASVFKANVSFLHKVGEQAILIHSSVADSDISAPYEKQVNTLLHAEPDLIHVYHENENDSLFPFFVQFNMKQAVYVPFVYGDNLHCLLIGKSSDEPWSATEREVMEGITKTISLALTNCYLFQEVEKGREQNSNLRALQISAQEKERQRIAQEIHDSINQSLSGIYFHLQYCRDEIEHSPQRVKGILDKLLLITKENINELRHVIHDLHPLAIQKFGFVGAVDELVKTFSLQEIIQIHLSVSGQPVRFKPEVEIHLYRVIQECVNNIIKHAGAGEAFIRMTFDDVKLSIVVEDHGCGFEPQKLKGSHAYGIMGMETRVRDIGGEMVLTSKPGHGTKIEISLQIGLRRGGVDHE
ncbi:UNVERIFIED_CONTAM: signal transduction histidine kinase [Brevibacillus sp. OAP136]